jgi:hypothetical protein
LQLPREEEDVVDLADSSAPPLNSLVYDVLFRPAELEDVAMWDQFSLYEKVRMSKSKSNLDGSSDETDIEDEEGTRTFMKRTFASLNSGSNISQDPHHAMNFNF